MLEFGAVVGNSTLRRNSHIEPLRIFVSYSQLDNVSSPDRRNSGLVNYFRRQVRWRLREEGMPDDAILWQDRSEIERGDVWSDARKIALNRAELFVVILSKNYITRPWFKQELGAMKSRVETLGETASASRIFLVYKDKVPESQVPDNVRITEAVRFYLDHNPNVVDNSDALFDPRIRRLSREYDKALLAFTSAIHRRVDELRTANALSFLTDSASPS